MHDVRESPNSGNTAPLARGGADGPAIHDPGLLDRATGVLIGQACGEVVGRPWTFRPLPGEDADDVAPGPDGHLGPASDPAPGSNRRPGFDPALGSDRRPAIDLSPGSETHPGAGEWGRATESAVMVVRVLASHDLDPRAEGANEALRDLAVALLGRNTRAGRRDAAAALRRHGLDRGPTADAGFRGRPELLASNRALARAGAVGLSRPTDRAATARAARAVTALTHTDPLAADSCVLWAEAVRVAVTERRLDIESGLDLIPPERRVDWLGWLTEASRPAGTARLRANGFTVTAVQAAWHAAWNTRHTVRSGRARFVAGIRAAVRIGGETDAVAALTGSLLGARYGAAAIPLGWQHAVHGAPGLGARELGVLARRAVQRAASTRLLLTLTVAGPGARPEERCPACKTFVHPEPAYPGYVCPWCVAWATDEAGRPIRLIGSRPISSRPGAAGADRDHPARAGGTESVVAARYDDGSPASAAVLAGRAWIRGREYRMDSTADGAVLRDLVAR